MKINSKTILTIIVFIVFPTLVMGQKQTRKVIENALERGIYKEYAGMYYITVENCDIDWDDFQAYFKKNPQYGADHIFTETRLRFGDEVDVVTSFEFHNNPNFLSTLEFGVRIENKDNDLKLPSFTDVKETERFYQKYVRNSSIHAQQFKDRFCEVYTNYCMSNPDEVKKLCDGSPYNNFEILKTLDVYSLLMKANKKDDYIFYLSADNGYYFDKVGGFRYRGEIKNGKPNGYGVNLEMWEGTFVDGKKEGNFTQSTWSTSYRWNDLGLGGFNAKQNHWFVFKRTGTCVNDNWNGEVVCEVIQNPVSYEITVGEDVVKEYYTNGELVNREVQSRGLTEYLQRQQELALQRQKELEESAKRARVEQQQRESAVNINNVMSYVKDISLKENNSLRTEYEVTFTDGKTGEIAFLKKTSGLLSDSDNWAWYCSGWFSGSYQKAEFNGLPNTREGALVGLFRQLHQ